jgi:hypothetical protein
MNGWLYPLADVIRDRIDERTAEAERERLARAARSTRAGPATQADPAIDSMRRRFGLRLIALGTVIAEGTRVDRARSEEPSAHAGGRA